MRCTARMNQPKETVNSRSFTDGYARSTEGTYRNITTTPVTVRIPNRIAETVPNHNE